MKLFIFDADAPLSNKESIIYYSITIQSIINNNMFDQINLLYR